MLTFVLFIDAINVIWQENKHLLTPTSGVSSAYKTARWQKFVRTVLVLTEFTSLQNDISFTTFKGRESRTLGQIQALQDNARVVSSACAIRQGRLSGKLNSCSGRRSSPYLRFDEVWRQ